MFNDPRSHEADDLALEAELLGRRGEHAGARELYRRAAALEEALARETPVSSPRQRGVLAISAVSLWGAAGALERAFSLAEAGSDEVDLALAITIGSEGDPLSVG